MLRSVAVALVLAVGLLSGPTPASHAYEVEPLIFDIAPAGRGASQTLVVTNTQQVPIVFEIVAERRMVDDFGVETRADATDDFLVIPPQARVEPGESQQIRVRYIGAPDIQSSQHYVITVRQLPLEDLTESGVQVLVNFAASVQVVPRRAEPAVRVVSAALEANEAGAPVARFLLENAGNRYQGMARSRITLSAAGRELELEGEAIGVALQHTLIPGGGRRWGVVELPADWPTDGALNVALDLPR